MIDWGVYRRYKVCGADMGAACRSRSGRINDGQPDRTLTPLAEPHKARDYRSARKHKGSTTGRGTPLTEALIVERKRRGQ